MPALTEVPPFLEGIPLEQLNQANSQSAAPNVPSYGASVKDDPPYSQEPEGVYFVYISVDDDFKLVVRQAYGELNGTDYRDIERELFDVTKNNITTDPRLVDRNFEKVYFYAPCWVTMVIDKSGWYFYYYDYANHDPVIFLDKKEVIEGGIPVPKSYSMNNSFFEARRDVLYGCSLVRFRNHFLNDDGEPITDEEINYGFQIYIRVPYQWSGGRLDEVTILIDPDGQNQGPDAP